MSKRAANRSKNRSGYSTSFSLKFCSWSAQAGWAPPRSLAERGVDAEQQMGRVVDQLRTCRWSRLDLCPWFVVRQMAAQCWRVRDAPGLRRADLPAVARPYAGRIKKLPAAPACVADDVDLLLLQYFQQTVRRRVERI